MGYKKSKSVIFFAYVETHFKLENASIFSAGKTFFISKILTDIHEKIRPFCFGIPESKKSLAIEYENR